MKNKALLDLTNAYVAIEGLLQSRVLSDETKAKLQEALNMLDRESAELLNEHAKEDHQHSLAVD